MGRNCEKHANYIFFSYLFTIIGFDFYTCSR